MSNDVINVQQLPKETVAKFVNDAAEMEVRKYSLKATAKDLAKRINETRNGFQRKWAYANKKIEDTKTEYEKALQEADNYTYDKYYEQKGLDLRISFGLRDFFIILFPILCIQTGILYNYIYSEDEIIPLILWAVATTILYTVIHRGFIINYLKKDHIFRKEELYRQAEQIKTKITEAQAEYNEVTEANKISEKVMVPLWYHHKMLKQSIADIDEVLKKHYAIGIIPPDYRDMIRVLYIQRAFRNDQADTIREATLLCDRDVHHGEVMQGLYEIASAIQCLSSTLNSIGRNIALMSDELTSITDVQQKLLSETESARYAAEAVQKSQESLLWYERQKWYRSNS